MSDQPVHDDGVVDVVASDVELVTGGHFHPDELGPETVAAVTARIAADPGPYVAAAGARLGPAFDARRESVSALPNLLALIPAGTPGLRETVEQALRHVEALLVVQDAAHDRQVLAAAVGEDVTNMLIRLDGRREALRRLLGDLP